MGQIKSTTRAVGRPKHDESSASVRSELLETAIDVIAMEGPTDVHAADIARLVGTTPAAITYNFGSWNGLIAEAAKEVYVNYIDELWRAVRAAERDPRARLRAYIAAQLAWAMRMPGWGAVFNYPFSVKSASEILRAKFGDITKAHFELNYARLIQLTIDVRDEHVTDVEWGVSQHPRAELLADTNAVFRATMNGWTVLGMMVWRSRGPTMESQIDEILQLQDKVIDWSIDQLVSAITSN